MIGHLLRLSSKRLGRYFTKKKEDVVISKEEKDIGFTHEEETNEALEEETKKRAVVSSPVLDAQSNKRKRQKVNSPREQDKNPESNGLELKQINSPREQDKSPQQVNATTEQVNEQVKEPWVQSQNQSNVLERYRELYQSDEDVIHAYKRKDLVVIKSHKISIVFSHAPANESIRDFLLLEFQRKGHQERERYNSLNNRRKAMWMDNFVEENNDFFSSLEYQKLVKGEGFVDATPKEIRKWLNKQKTYAMSKLEMEGKEEGEDCPFHPLHFRMDGESNPICKDCGTLIPPSDKATRKKIEYHLRICEGNAVNAVNATVDESAVPNHHTRGKKIPEMPKLTLDASKVEPVILFPLEELNTQGTEEAIARTDEPKLQMIEEAATRRDEPNLPMMEIIKGKLQHGLQSYRRLTMIEYFLEKIDYDKMGITTERERITLAEEFAGEAIKKEFPDYVTFVEEEAKAAASMLLAEREAIHSKGYDKEEEGVNSEDDDKKDDPDYVEDDSMNFSDDEE